MAKDKEQKLEVGTDAQTDPKSQTPSEGGPQPQVRSLGSQTLTLEGDKKAKVNPSLDVTKVTIPTGIDENGVTTGDNFYKGKPYYVSSEALQVKNTSGVPLLVEDK